MKSDELKDFRRRLGSANADLSQAWANLEEYVDEITAIAETEDEDVDLEGNRELIMSLVRTACLQIIVNVGRLHLIEAEEEEE